LSEGVPVHEGLWEVGDDGKPRLLGGRCGTCDRHHFPRFPTCPWCSAGTVEGAPLSGEGRLWGWTSVAVAPPGYDGDVPFGFGVVELPEGIRVVSRLTEDDAFALEFGQPMRLTVVALGSENDGGEPMLTWAFSPEGAGR